MKTALITAMAALGVAAAAPAFANDADYKNLTPQQAVDAKFEKFDTNKDGILSKSEIDASKHDKLAHADANKDGNVSKSELLNWKDAKANR